MNNPDQFTFYGVVDQYFYFIFIGRCSWNRGGRMRGSVSRG